MGSRIRFPVLMLAAALVGCGTTQPVGQPMGDEFVVVSGYGDGAGRSVTASSSNQTPNERLLAWTASVHLRHAEPDSILNRVVRMAESENGYMVSRSNASVTVRVPASALDRVYLGTRRLAQVTHHELRSTDLTEQIYDAEARIAVLTASRARMLELLGRAENVATAVEVERELTRLNGELDSITGRLNRMRGQVSYSQIQVFAYREPQEPRPGPLGYVFVKAYQAVLWLFVWD